MSPASIESALRSYGWDVWTHRLGNRPDHLTRLGVVAIFHFEKPRGERRASDLQDLCTSYREALAVGAALADDTTIGCNQCTLYLK